MLKVAERRFQGDVGFQQLYQEFLNEYERLGHMSPMASISASSEKQVCFLPHHGVVREASASTKLRVVFNGSARTRAGHSLNDLLMVGSNLLPRLADVLLRWRRHRYVYSTDVEKMYRQIEVHPDDRNLQKILWRNGETLQEY